MNAMEPIRDKEQLEEIKDYLKTKSLRNYMMFYIGINTGLRIGDLLKLRVNDVAGKAYITLTEGKTGKDKKIRIPDALKKELKLYCKGKRRHEFLLLSREGRNKPITRAMAYKILKDVGDEFGLDCIGCHSLRKTYAYHMYQDKGDLPLTMVTLNHTKEKDTLKYLGVTQERWDDYQKGLDL